MPKISKEKKDEITPKIKQSEVFDLGEIGGKKIISSVNISDHKKLVTDIAGSTFIIPIE